MLASCRRRQPAGATPARLNRTTPRATTRFRMATDSTRCKRPKTSGAASRRAPERHRRRAPRRQRHDHVGTTDLEARERGKGTARCRDSPTMHTRAQRGRRGLATAGNDGDTRRGRRRGTRRRARLLGSPSDSLHRDDGRDAAELMQQTASQGELHSGAIDGDLVARVSGWGKKWTERES